MFSGNSAQRTSRVHNLTRSLNHPLSYNNCVGHSIQLLNFTGQTIVKRFSSPMAEYTMIDTTEINRYQQRGDQTSTVLSRPEKYNRTFKTPVTHMIIPSLWTIFKVPDPIPFSVKKIPTTSWPKGQHSWDKVPLVLISHLGTARAQRCHRSTGACTLCTDQTTFSRVNCAPPVSQHTPLSQGFSSKMATRLANSGGAPTILNPSPSNILSAGVDRVHPPSSASCIRSFHPIHLSLL